MSWPPRSSRGQGQGGGGTNSLPLGAVNDPMDMGAMRNSLQEYVKTFADREKDLLHLDHHVKYADVIIFFLFLISLKSK